MKLSESQEAAIGKAIVWYNKLRVDKPIFRVFGYAGTGKTTVLEEMTRRLGIGPSSILFLAPTGKAAAVMSAKGCDAKTIHSQFYTLVKASSDHMQALVDEREDIEDRFSRGTDEANREALQRRLRLIDQQLGTPRVDLTFSFKGTLAVPPGTRLIVVDEASMVENNNYRDLASLMLPIIFVGDPGQLPPVGLKGGEKHLATEAGNVDVLLTEVHRQQSESSILDIAHLAREGGYIHPGDDGSGVRVIDSRRHRGVEIIADQHGVDLLQFDQILVGTNNNRKALNQHIKNLRNIRNPWPTGEPGEKVMATSRFRDGDFFIPKGAIVGIACDDPSVGRITARGSEYPIDYLATVCTIDGKVALRDEVPIWRYPFEDQFGQDRPREYREELPARRCLQADWSWAMTVHKAQGSQWDKVCIFDDWRDRETRPKWLYTAATRASKELTIFNMV